MTNSPLTPGVVPGRLPDAEIAANFADFPPPLDDHEALVAADRCYFCYDAPCTVACPTSIDIPMFIRQISTGTPEAAAKTIWDQNILGGMCARVCPVEQLCEGACVREEAEGKPVEIGRLQRYATDVAMAQAIHPYTREAPTGRRVAVVGAGPAGLACAHRLAMKGHDVTIFEKKAKPGGLNEYGLAAYKTTGGFAQEEIEWLRRIGGITIRNGVELGRDVTLAELQRDHDAVFLGTGLQGVNALGIEGEEREGVESAIDFIQRLRQSADLAQLPVGRDVVVIGGGMTAVDAAVQSRHLGALNVTMVYRRSQARMPASLHEQEHAAQAGVRIIHNAAPVRILGNGRVEAVEFAYTEEGPDGRLRLLDDRFTLKADQLFKAIGQTLTEVPAGIAIEGGKIALANPLPGVWVGGDNDDEGEDLTVTAVARGRDAAEAIHSALTAA